MVSSRSLTPARCRRILDDDIRGVVELLRKGFRLRSRAYWLRAFDRLAQHPTPAAMPKYGYLLESAGTPVGVLLLISSKIQDGDTFTIRCNVSSWYVEPKFRSLAPLLALQATRKTNITYLNTSPAEHTLPTVEAQGFSRFSDGQFVASVFPSSRRRSPAEVVGCDTTPNAYFEQFEQHLLLAHAEYGCISIWCTTSGRAYPFVFLPRVVKYVVPCVQLIYCQCLEDFVRFAQPIGSYLASRGWPFVLIDSKGPIRGLAGKYFDGIAPKYFKGSVSPRLGDLAYTEGAMFETGALELCRILGEEAVRRRRGWPAEPLNA
jgi:hypothetical protein